MKKLMAFTLAEVLITIIVVGVVASLTIPTLMNNFRKKQYVTQLKKTYNQLTNGFHLIMARDGVTKLSDTSLLQNLSACGDSCLENWENAEFASTKNEFEKTFNAERSVMDSETIENYPFFDPNTGTMTFGSRTTYTYGLCFTDGSCIDEIVLYPEDYGMKADCGGHICTSLKEFQEVNHTTSKLMQAVGDILIDVNGLKAPNQMGRDKFEFLLGNDGNLYPIYGRDYAGLNSCQDTGLNSCSQYWNNGNFEHCSLPDGDASGCAARIMEEGWKMNY